MKITANCNVAFGQSRIHEYTPHQVKIMRDMKKAALKNGWCDIYTGEVFSSQNPPTIEHIIPCSHKQNHRVVLLIKERCFQLNGLDNIFPVGSMGNSCRQSQVIQKTILRSSVILKRLLLEFEKYEGYSSDLINGRDWVKRLKGTLVAELAGICSDIETGKIRVAL